MAKTIEVKAPAEAQKVEKSPAEIRKEQLIAVNEALNKIDEMLPRMEKILTEYQNTQGLAQLKNVLQGAGEQVIGDDLFAYLRDIIPRVQEYGLANNINVTELLGTGREETLTKYNGHEIDAEHPIEAVILDILRTVAAEQEKKPLLPAGEYVKIARAYMALDTLRDKILDFKGKGDLRECMNVIESDKDTDYQTKRVAQVSLFGYNRMDVTYKEVERIYATLDALTKEATEKQGGILKEMGFASQLSLDCDVILSTKDPGYFFPDDLVKEVRKIQTALDEAHGNAQRNFENGQFKEAEESFGDADALKNVETRLNEIKNELKELNELNAETRPKPAEEKKAEVAPKEDGEGKYM